MESSVESEVVVAARAGDRRAAARLVEDYLPLVYNIVGRALNGSPDTDDVVQEAMIRVVQGLPTLRDPDRFRSWVVSIAIRQIHERIRARQRLWGRQTSLEVVGERPDPALDFVGLTVLELGLSGQRREVAEATRWLTDDDRELLALWWQEVAGVITRPELADALRISPAHAAVRVQRTKAKLDTARTALHTLGSRGRCPGLMAVLAGWNGMPDPRLLGPLGKHIHDCGRCQAVARRLVPPNNLLSGVALVPVPALLADRLPDVLAGLGHAASLHGGGGHAALLSLKGLSLKPAIGVGAAATTVAVGLSFAVFYPQLEPPVPPAATSSPTVTSAPATPTPAAPPAPRTVRAPSPSGSPPPSAGPSTVPAVAVPRGVVAADWYVSPTGSDSAAGTLAAPFATLTKAVSVVRAGQTIALRGGTYRPTKPITIEPDGTASARITLTNYGEEHPVIDASTSAAGPFVQHHGAYWTVQGLEIRNARGNTYVCEGCVGEVFRRLTIRDGAATGFVLRDDGTRDNQVLDSDFSGHHDVSGLADGLAVIYGSGSGNVIRGCRFWGNTGDGMQTSVFGSPVTIEDSWSWGNTSNGFALGSDDGMPVAHLVRDSAAWDNDGYGFTEAGNTGAISVSTSTAFGNGKDGFAFFNSPSSLTRNLALGNAREARLNDTVTESGNSWNTTGWDASKLASTDPASAQGPRPANGALPRTTFLVASGIGAPMS